MVPVFVALPGLCFGGAALQRSVRRVHHQPEIEQMTTVADGTPLYEAAGLSFTAPTESCRKLPAALPREETIVTRFHARDVKASSMLKQATNRGLSQINPIRESSATENAQTSLHRACPKATKLGSSSKESSRLQTSCIAHGTHTHRRSRIRHSSTLIVVSNSEVIAPASANAKRLRLTRLPAALGNHLHASM